MTHTGARALGVAILVTLFLAAGTAQAKEKEGGDGEAAAKALLTEITAALKHPDRDGLASALAKLPDAHNGLPNAGLRKKLLQAAGKALRDKKGGESRRSAAAALGLLDDPAGAYKELAKSLPQAKDKEATPTQLEAMRSVGALAPEAAVSPLLKLLEKSPSLPVAAEAAQALGGFGSSKKREAILKALLDLMAAKSAAAAAEATAEAAAKDSKKASKKSDGGAQRAWQALEEPLVQACNKLTQQNHAGGQAWLEAYAAHKKNLGSLFPARTG